MTQPGRGCRVPGRPGLAENSLHGRSLNPGQGAQVPVKDGAGGCQEPGPRAQGWGRNSVRGGEGQRTKWRSWQGAHKGLALTPSLAVPQP